MHLLALCSSYSLLDRNTIVDLVSQLHGDNQGSHGLLRHRFATILLKKVMLLYLAGIGLLEIAFFLAFIIGWIWSIIDVVRNDSLKGISKAVWLFVIVLFPFFGTLFYLIFGRRRLRSA